MSPSVVKDPLLDGLQVYIVGGAVRDEMLGRPVGDRDWVVVGSNPQEMISRGFMPVGSDFPVFLHPQTKEEYALARTERKSGRGYKGFTFYTGADVTLEDDLRRRDLTINAMARTLDGALVDPLGGALDLQRRCLRHVGPAFEEDPVRILRLARFAARFTDFVIAPETVVLCQRMVALGEVDALVAERVWQEVSRGLMSEKPSRLFDVLDQCRALPIVMPGFVWHEPLAHHLDGFVTNQMHCLAGMYAIAMLDTPVRDTLGQRLRAPVECVQWARLLPEVMGQMDQSVLSDQWSSHALALIERADGIRRPDRLQVILTIASVLRGEEPSRWLAALEAARAVDAGAIARPLQVQGAVAIQKAIHAARASAIKAGGGGHPV